MRHQSPLSPQRGCNCWSLQIFSVQVTGCLLGEPLVTDATRHTPGTRRLSRVIPGRVSRCKTCNLQPSRSVAPVGLWPRAVQAAQREPSGGRLCPRLGEASAGTATPFPGKALPEQPGRVPRCLPAAGPPWVWIRGGKAACGRSHRGQCPSALRGALGLRPAQPAASSAPCKPAQACSTAPAAVIKLHKCLMPNY